MKIHSIEVMNVIVPGTRINEKTCILDILLTLNHERTLNIEMQVLNEYDWTDRSLVYLSRIFNNVNSGEEYSDVIPATHIGFLNFQLFKDDPAFFSEFKISNVKTHKVYSDKFVLDVVSLNCIDLATPEDVESGLVDWARFFTASTWEELQMLAANNPAIEDAASTAVKGMSDDKLKWEIMLREEASRRYQTREAYFKRAEKRAVEAEEKLAVSEEKLAVSEEKLAETDKKLTEAERKNSDLEAEVTRLREALSKYE
jgi:predicted transposase/invertase (TIGR01784 family)